MKKALFTIQMIALMAMLPVYLVVELNHTNERIPDNNPGSSLNEKTEKTLVKPAMNEIKNQVPL